MLFIVNFHAHAPSLQHAHTLCSRAQQLSPPTPLLLLLLLLLLLPPLLLPPPHNPAKE